MSRYHKTLDRIRSNPSPERFAHMTAEQIDAAIAEISAEMKGPLSNTERALHFADRVDLRAARAALARAGGGE